MPLAPLIVALGVLTGNPVIPSGAEPPLKVAVLSIDLNNLHKTEPDTALLGRIRRLANALRTRLAGACGYEVVAFDSQAEAAAHLTDEYFYEHPDVAAALAGRAGADWVVIPRLNRASAWASDLQAHVVRVRDAALINNRIVEFKGLELGPELAERLIERGAAWMADQISQVLEHSQHPAAPSPRRCSPQTS
ncbi:MAG TPA: DUF2380 domain-containing protein [Gemmatimonadales bacterium]|jgi:hypothetical protein